MDAGRRNPDHDIIGCNVYLVFDRDEWILIDIGYEDTVDQIVELIRQMDFPLSQCKTLIATHADVDQQPIRSWFMRRWPMRAAKASGPC